MLLLRITATGIHRRLPCRHAQASNGSPVLATKQTPSSIGIIALADILILHPRSASAPPWPMKIISLKLIPPGPMSARLLGLHLQIMDCQPRGLSGNLATRYEECSAPLCVRLHPFTGPGFAGRRLAQLARSISQRIDHRKRTPGEILEDGKCKVDERTSRASVLDAHRLG